MVVPNRRRRTAIFIENILEKVPQNNWLEIIVNGTQSICHKDFQNQWHTHSPLLKNSAQLTEYIQEFAFSKGLRLDPIWPHQGGYCAKNQWRWHAVIPPITDSGGILSLRRQKFHALSLKDFEFLNFSEETLKKTAQRKSGLNIISGRTGSGKSSLLATILKTYFTSSRVVIIETHDEIPCLSPLWTKLCEAPPIPSQRDKINSGYLLEQTLRLSPDCIVLGEVRGSEASALLHSSLCGHSSVLTTLHCSSKKEALRRLTTLEPKFKSQFFTSDLEVFTIQNENSRFLVEHSHS